MRQEIIICEHCGSTKIVRDPEISYAKVQEKDPNTNAPIGPWQTFFIFKCLSCGKRLYVEKHKAQVN